MFIDMEREREGEMYTIWKIHQDVLSRGREREGGREGERESDVHRRERHISAEGGEDVGGERDGTLL
jgi:hypothetical protein